MGVEPFELGQLQSMAVVDINEPGIVVRAIGFPLSEEPVTYFNRIMDEQYLVESQGGGLVAALGAAGLRSMEAGQQLKSAGMSSPMSFSVVENGFITTIARAHMTGGLAYVLDPGYIFTNSRRFRFVGDDTVYEGEKGALSKALGGVPYGLKMGKRKGDKLETSIDEIRCYSKVPMSAVIGIVSHNENYRWMPEAMRSRLEAGKTHYPVYSEDGLLLWHPNHSNGLGYDEVRASANIHYGLRRARL
jgi:hypothetical protein